MKKRTFRLVALAVLVVVCICATTVLAACNKSSTYYLSTKSNDWTTYGKKDTVPDDVKFTLQEDGTYSLTVNLEAGDSFAIRETGKDGNLVQEIFSADTKLSLDGDGNVAVGATGSYVLNIDLSNGELSYGFTAPSPQDPTPTTVAVTGVSLNTKTLNLTVGGSDATLTATVAPTDATNQNVSWSSSAESVATVSDGTVHAVAAGDAVITVTTEDGSFTDTCNVHVSVAQSGSVAVTGVSLSPAGPINMTVGGADVTLTATVAPSDATNKNVSWSSSVPTVATVNNGVVHALAPGDTVITVTTQDGGKTATCNVHVEAAQQGGDPIPVNSIYFEEDDFSLSVGGTATLTVVVDPDNATDKSFTWSVDNEGVVRIEVSNEDDHVLNVTALTAGEVTVTLASTGTPNAESYPITITVNSVAAQSITLDPSSWTMEVGDEKDIVATVLPANATYTLTWSSDNESCVSVDQNGHIEALATGTATITATIRGDLFATCEVEVAQHVSSISLNPSSLELYQGDDPRTISVVFNPTSATNKGFSAEITAGTGNITVSDNQATGTITVTPVAVGTATITVTSTDGGYTATCSVEVKALSDAKPYLQDSTVEINIASSDTITINAPTGITISSYTVTSAQTTIATVTKGSNNDFTVTGVAFGVANVTVSVTYTGGSSSSTTLTLTVYVVSDFFYLTGTVDGTSWGSYSDEASARNAKMLLEKVSTGVYEIERGFAAGEKLYVLPSILNDGTSDDWAFALKKGYYTATSGMESYFTTPDSDNVAVTYTGYYTVRLTISDSGVSWTIEMQSIYPTSASIDGNLTLKENEVTDTTLTLTITPDVATVSSSDIEWSVKEAEYKDWLSLVPGSDALTCIINLTQFEGNDQVTITILVTITYGTDQTLEKSVTITIIPEGGTEIAVDHVSFDQAVYTFDVGTTWDNIQVSATAYAANSGETPTDATIIYSIVSGGDVKYNSDGGTAFTINSETGVITAMFFGTIKVRATSNADETKYAEIDVLIYSSNMIIAGAIGGVTGEWSSNPTYNYTSLNNSKNVYTWEGVELYAGDIVVFMYLISDWDKGMTRSGDYLTSCNPTGAITGASGSANGKYNVVTKGIYTITLDISGATPSVSFNKTGDLASDATVTLKLIVENQSDPWPNNTLVTQSAAIGSVSGNYTITLTYAFTGNESSISSVSNDTWIAFYIAQGDTWEQSVNITVSGISNSWSDGKTKFTCAKSAVVNKTITAVCTFDQTSGALTKVAITVS